jgi:hypothetical protein
LLGVDRAVSYGVFSRAWGVIAGPITMVIIAGGFSKEQQGFYYTISSLLALQIFFELGLMTVIAQFASHEFARLNWRGQGEIEGDPIALSRFIDLLCKSVKWFGVASLLLVIGLIPTGLVFFDQGHHQDFAWRIPWILAVLGTAMNLFVTPFYAVIMGSGDVVTVNHRQMIGNIIGTCVSWLVMGLHGGLYAVFAVNAGNIIISWSYLIRYKPALLRLVWAGIIRSPEREDGKGLVSWWGEVWPMQWKIALSWVSGYFVFQLFNPVLFHYHGSAVAGQMGMSLSAANALLGVCITWVNAKNPEFCRLVVKRDWEGLEKTFFRILLQSTTVVTIGAVVGWSAIALIQMTHPLGERFLPAGQMALLLASVVIQNIIYGFATYLRAHKQEPLLAVSIVAALLQGTATWFLGSRYSSLGATGGYIFVSLFFSLPATYFVWRRFNSAYHTN